MSVENSYNFKKISNKVTTSGVLTKNMLNSLGTEGYEIVFNLLPENHKKSVPGEKEIIEGQGILYVNIPVDFEEPKHGDLDQFISELQNIGDKKIHIHCAANWRVTVFYGLYAFQSGLWNKDETVNFIFSIWNPDDYPAWSSLLKHFGLGKNER